MKDLIVVLMTVGFFAACVAYVALCDRIVGADGTEGDAGAPNGAATGAASRPAMSVAVDVEVS